MKTTLQRLGKGLAILAAAVPLSAFAFPDKPIRMVVPYSAGGGADNTARVVAQKMGEILGQTVVIDNKPGQEASSAPMRSRRRHPMAIRCCTMHLRLR
ncbi:hypothetical protein [Cupriavidus sp. BIC8F]|uniref:hypothetical protein n=1 Tax=Cupriavidus sp. BIC8F TaxID=3079014 RepID=UPI00291610FE|nr:hypothetical protein [Cupriavidus sp. BIC8F]